MSGRDSVGACRGARTLEGSRRMRGGIPRGGLRASAGAATCPECIPPAKTHLFVRLTLIRNPLLLGRHAATRRLR